MRRLAFLLVVLLSLATFSQCYIRVSLMMPLSTVSNNGDLNNPAQLQKWLYQAAQGGVNGVMLDFWWGIVEAAGPKHYNWTVYVQFVEMAQAAGLHVQPVFSFHQCGDNVGDECYIPLPQWILTLSQQNSDIFYKDSTGSWDTEYLSLGVDSQTLFYGRTALQMYSDYMSSFYSTFSPYIANGTINQVQIGMGPSGELRYPSYRSDKWTYCGIGAFQCYDKYMLADLANAAQAAGHPEWGTAGPNDAGSYDSQPSQTGFFSDGTTNNYASAYGDFFLNWYFGKILTHADNILSSAQNIFGGKVQLAAKVAGIHWWYATDSHAAEVTAGYYNTDQHNAYAQLAQVFSKYSAAFDFTCLEMTDSSSCSSAPQELVKQTILAAQSVGISYAGENALDLCQPNCYSGGFDEIYTEATQYGAIERFTYLRMSDNLMDNPSNWSMFCNFIARMHAAG